MAEAAFQHALTYAMDRKQGKTPLGTGTIIDHADVRRMLAEMKAEIFAARAIGLACAVAIDMARATGDATRQARAALLTPIAKAYGTDTGHHVAHLGVQVHGGMGFIEETGAAQFARDVRITQIYEGTNGIQAMDLVGRKMMDGGEAAFRLIDEMQDAAETARAALPDLATPVWTAAEALREATETLVAQPMNDRFAGAVAYQSRLRPRAWLPLPPAGRRGRPGPPAAGHLRHPPPAARTRRPSGAGPRRRRRPLRPDARGAILVTAACTTPSPDAPTEHETIEVAPGIHWLRLPLPMVLNHVNCYALDDGDSWTLVDTGMATKHAKALWQALLAVPLRGKPVARLIVTHHHPDHIGLAGWFQEQGVELDHHPHRLALCPDADPRRTTPALARITAVLPTRRDGA